MAFNVQRKAFIALILLCNSITGQIISTIAGTGVSGYSGDGAKATLAKLSYPFGVAVDTAGNVYFSDNNNDRIRMISASSGNISTIAGTGAYGYTGDGGPAINAKLSSPAGVALDRKGNLLFCDEFNYVIRKINLTTGVISTVAGNNVQGYSGDGGPATSAEINSPQGLACDTAGNIYIADFLNNRIRKVDAFSGNISTVAGNGTLGYYGDGGPATLAEINKPLGITVSPNGDIFIADTYNYRVRKVESSSGLITTVIGNGSLGFGGDGGLATLATIGSPLAIAIDDSLNLYITGNARIRKISATSGLINTIAGTGNYGCSGDGGPPLMANLDNVNGIATDNLGAIYTADGNFNRIRKISSMLSTTMVLNNPSCAALCSGLARSNPKGGTAPYTYKWSSGQTTQMVSSLCAGSYTVTVKDFYGLKTTDSITITQTAPLKINTVVVNTCLGTSLGNITANVSGGTPSYYYKWSNGKNGQTVSGLSGGNYKLTITDANSCIDSTIVNIASMALPIPTIMSNSSVCAGESLSLTASGGLKYKWSNGDTTAVINSIPVSTTTYSLTITNASGCVATTSQTVIVNSLPSITVMGAGTLLEGDSKQLIASGGISFTWLPSKNLSCADCFNPIANPEFSTNYCVQITDSNSCVKDTCVKLTVICGDIFVPNAFSPNNDGENDVLYLRGGRCIKTFSFAIFNRLGEKVFETSNKTSGWDGTFSGESCNTGVFVYYIQGTMLDETGFEQMGNITLLR